MSSRRVFSLEFKQAAVWQVEELGRSLSEVARELDLRPDQLASWCSQLRSNKMPSWQLKTAFQAETVRLRRELDVARQVDALVLEGQPAVRLPLVSLAPIEEEVTEPPESVVAEVVPSEAEKQPHWIFSPLVRVPLLLLIMAAMFWGVTAYPGTKIATLLGWALAGVVISFLGVAKET